MIRIKLYILYLLLFTASIPFYGRGASIIPIDEVGKHNVRLIENKGQWESNILFKAHIPGGTLYVTPTGLQYQLVDEHAIFEAIHNRKNGTVIKEHIYNVNFVGANTDPVVQTFLPSKEYYNYFIGSNPEKWKSECRAYGKIILSNLYNGIDLELISLESRIKINFIVHPFANPNDINLAYQGANSLKIEDNKLLVETDITTMQEQAPVSYQTISNKQTKIETQYILSNNTLSFKVDDYNQSISLTIDPEIIFATFSGSFADNWGYTATNDTSGNAYSGGTVHESGTFAPVTGSFQTVWKGGFAPPYARDCGILKYTSDGKSLLWATYLGGTNNEGPHSMICDKSGKLYVMGATWSTDFPTTASAFDKTHNGKADLYVSILSADGRNLLASTFVGGSENDAFNGTNDARPSNEQYDPVNNTPLAYNYGDYFRGEIQLDKFNNVYVVTATFSNNIPMVNAAQSTFGGKEDAFIVRLNSNLSSIGFSTYLGGAGYDAAYGIAIDNLNNLFICGGTTSASIGPDTGIFVHHGNVDAFVSNYSSTGTLLKTICYGTNKYDQAYLIQIDSKGSVYITGQSEGVIPTFGSVYSVNNTHQFISAFDVTLSSVLVSTNFGVPNTLYPDISPSAFLVDICNRVYVSGWGGVVNWGVFNSNLGSTSGLFITPDAKQKTTDGSDFYLIVFDPFLTAVSYASYLGGPSSLDHVDGGTSRFDKDGIIYQSVCGGCGGKSDFPCSPGAYSEVNNSTNCNNALFKMDLNTTGVAPIIRDTSLLAQTITDTLLFTQPNDTFKFVFDVRDFGGLTISTNYFGNILSQFPNAATVTKTIINPSFHRFRISWPVACYNVGDTVTLFVNTSNNNCPNPLSSVATIKIFVHALPPLNPPFPECINHVNDSTIGLKWTTDNKPLKNVAAYNVYKKTGSGNYNLLNRVLSSQLFLFDSTAQNHLSQNYCYYITAEDVCGGSSAPSRLICSMYKEDTATTPGFNLTKDTILYLNAFDTLDYSDTIFTHDSKDSAYISLSGSLVSTGRVFVKTTTSSLGKAFFHFKWNSLCTDILSKSDTLKLKFFVYDNECPTIRTTEGLVNVVVFPPPLNNPPSLHCVRKMNSDEVTVRWTNIPVDKYFSHYTLIRKNPDGSIIKITDLYGDTIANVLNGAPDNESTNYCYALVPVNICGTNGDTSQFQCTVHQPSEYPPGLYIYTVTVEDNKNIVVKWKNTEISNFLNYDVYRHTLSGGAEQLIKSNFTDTIIKDTNVKVMLESYCYKVKQTNDCGLSTNDNTTEACSILLTGTSNPFEHQIEWNPYQYWEKGTKDYSVFRSQPTVASTYIGQTIPSNTKFTDGNLDIENGLYFYTVVATEDPSGYGYNSTSNTIELIQKPMVYTPNAFTPNDDNLNDNWVPHPVFVKEYSLKIYNRWGQLLFETNDKHETFNGKFLNQNGAEDAYVYLITYTGWDKSSHIQKGNVTILR